MAFTSFDHNDMLACKGYSVYCPSEHTDCNILMHSNGVCLVTLAKDHPIVHKEVASVDFQTTQKTNRLKNKVIGRSKKGGQQLRIETPLCKIKCTDSSEYVICSCIDGKLLEVNEELVTNPSLLTTKPTSKGYIAVIQPSRTFNISEHSKIQVT